MTLGDYLPILMYAVLVIMFGVVSLLASQLLAPKSPNAAKLAPYECGIVPQDEPKDRFSVKFYLVAMLFIVFDLETVFLYPWAVVFRQLGVFGLAEMGVFLFVLLVGYVYVWRRGALEWK